MEKRLYNPRAFFANPGHPDTVEITIINVCDILDEICPDWESVDYDETGELIRNHAEEIGAVIYCRPHESFFIREACKEAYESGRDTVIVEDLS